MAIVAEPLRPRAATEPRAASLHFIGRLFREKPLGAAGGVVFLLFLLCGIFADLLAPYGMNQISPHQPPASRRRGPSRSAPTISAATCSRAASTARSSR